MADKEAKKGATMPFPNLISKLSNASLSRWISDQNKLTRGKWWDENIPQSYSELKIKIAPRIPMEFSLNRKALGCLIAARTGHGDFSAYHIRFKHQGANLHCKCGSLKTPRHFFFCRILRRRSGRPEGSINELLPKLLGTPEGAVTLTNWLSQAQFFEQICPR